MVDKNNSPTPPAPSLYNPSGGFNLLLNGGAKSTSNPEITLFLFSGKDTKYMQISEDPAFKDVKKQLLEDFNVIAIVSLPSGVFLPYAGVKTNVLFFEKTTSTKKIRYYEVDPGRKLTKNKPITVDELQEMIDFFPEKTESEQSRFVHIDDINDFDLSAKNPNKIKEITHLPPKEILAKIKANDEEIRKEVAKLEEILL